MILDAGFDSRAYRLPAIEREKVFEADLPAVQEDKKKTVQMQIK
jgi:O-methyltransferase involved in polyketide biosynthesis